MTTGGRRPPSRFKRGDRVEWYIVQWATDRKPYGEWRMVGTVKDVHRLGGYGYAYEVEADRADPTGLYGRGRTFELAQEQVAPLPLLDQIVEAMGFDELGKV